MRSRQRRHKPVVEINVVPYIDVMLVLLIIFMVTTPLLTQGVKVNLPKAAAKAITVSDSTPIVVTVDKDGLYYLSTAAKPTKPISPVVLSNNIAAQLRFMKLTHKTRKILVRGDRDVDYGKVVRAMVLLQKAGATSVGLITSSEGNATHA